jgi:CubicO group peptidase (beta-lactamase class C family)
MHPHTSLQTKPLVAAGVMMLVERGQIGLDDPLHMYHGGFRCVLDLTTPPTSPSHACFASNSPRLMPTPPTHPPTHPPHSNMRVTDWNGGTVPANRDITIRDLLCHTAGLGYSGGFNDPTGDGILSSLRTPFESIQQFVDDLAAKPLWWQPGSTWRYSWSYDVLGYVIQKVTHQTPDAFLRVNLFNPLKMYDTDFYVPAGKIDRFAVAYTKTRAGLVPILRPRMDPLQAFRPPTFLSCGSGIVSTLTDYARFGMMLMNGGELEGVRVLRSETVDMMWRNQISPELLPMDLNGWKSDDYTGACVRASGRWGGSIGSVDRSTIMKVPKVAVPLPSP